MQLLPLIGQIDVIRTGIVIVGLKKIAIEDDGSMDWGYHGMFFHPGDDAEYILDANTKNLAELGYGEFTQAEWDRALRVVHRVQTKEVNEAFAERLARIKARENPDATLDRAVVFEQVTIFRNTPACDPDRIDDLISAMPVQIKVGFKPKPLPLFRLLPGADVVQAKIAFERNIKAVKDWTGVVDMAIAEHTPEVVEKFSVWAEAKAKAKADAERKVRAEAAAEAAIVNGLIAAARGG